MDMDGHECTLMDDKHKTDMVDEGYKYPLYKHGFLG
jgi:hypothetical protein